MIVANIQPQKFRLRARLAFDEINWALALSILVSRFEIPFDQASQMLKSLRLEIFRPLSLYWFMRSTLNSSARMVMLAVCQAHGIDQLTIDTKRALRFGIFNIDYTQVISFAPHFDSQEGLRTTEVFGVTQTLCAFGLKLGIRTRHRLVLVQTILAALAAIAFSAFAGLLLYGVSVLLVFVMSPATVTIAATRSAPLGIALVCSLIGIAGIFGRAFANLAGEARVRLLPQFLSKSHSK